MIPLKNPSFDRGLSGIMAFIVAISLSFSLAAMTLSDFISDWSRGVKNSISVSVLFPDDMQADMQQKITAKIEQILSQTKGVKKSDILSEIQKNELLSHWLGDKIDKTPIDLPTLWDITVAHNFDVSALQSAVQDIYEGAVVDDYMHWKNTLLQFARDMVVIAYVLAAIGAMVLIVLISLCMRTLVLLHMDTIRVLALLGASDGFILRDVGRYAFWTGFKSAVYGVILCVAAYITLLLWYTDVTLRGLFDVDWRSLFLANMLPIIGVCAIVPAVAIMSRIGARYSAKKCIRNQYCI